MGVEARGAVALSTGGPERLRECASAAARFYRRLERERPALLRAFYRDAFLAHARRLRDGAQALERTLTPGGTDGSLLRELCRRVRETAAALESLGEAFRLPFLLFIVGMGKYGKSTLVNALAGQEVAPVDFLPRTWKIDIYEGSENGAYATLRYRDGREERLDCAAAKQRIAEEEARRERSEQAFASEFRRRAGKLRTVEEKEELIRMLRARILYRSPIQEVRWPCPRKGIFRRFAIVDTPGLWQHERTGDPREDLRDYYHKADGVIWLLDATKLTGRQAREMLNDLDRTLALVGTRRSNMLAVVNRMDLVREHPGAEARVVAEIERRFAGVFDEIIPMSAREAYQAACSGDPLLAERSGLRALLDGIERRFASRAAELQILKKMDGARAYLSLLAQAVQAYKDRLAADEARRAQLERDIENELNHLEGHLKEAFRPPLSAFIEAASQRVWGCRDRLRQLSQQPEPEEQLRRFITQEIVREPELQALMTRCMNEAAAAGALVLAQHWVASQFREYSRIEPSLPSPKLSAGIPSVEVKAAIDAALGRGGFWDAVEDWLAFILGPIWGNRAQHRLWDMLGKLKGDAENLLDAGVKDLCSNVRHHLKRVREQTYADLHGPSEGTPARMQGLEELLKACELQVRKPELARLLVRGGGH